MIISYSDKRMKEKTVINLFEDQVNENPHQIAVSDELATYSYEELNGNINQLARLLAKHQVGLGVIVNVFLPLGKDLIASMLAIFKANGIYLPINKTFSEKRLKTTLSLTYNGVLITDSLSVEFILQKLEEFGIRHGKIIVLGDALSFQVIDLESGKENSGELSNYDPENFQSTSPESESYIYFTSGSTGEAKPILGCHKSLHNYIQWVVREFEINPSHTVAHLSQSAFDASLKDVFMALCSGATLAIPPAWIKENMHKLISWLHDQKVSIMQTVPSVFRLMMKGIRDNQDSGSFEHMKHIMLDGEVLFEKDVMNWRSLVGDHTELVNLYGTTESTILDTFHRIDKISGNPGQAIHVGQPIDNTFILIINNGNLCRIGEIGEVYIKTPYLTKGYYKNKELTEQLFVQNPLISDKKDIVYKTGDLGRYLKGRDVEILGRKDKQVKVNGVRIEINEIEKEVLQIEEINDVAIIVHTNTESNLSDLICYYESKSNIDAKELKRILAQSLNANTIPAYFIQLEQFPLNTNGKLDKKKLPLPEDLYITDDFEPCTGATEKKLESIWTEVLGRERFGRNESFMEVGGQSLKAIQIVSRVYKVFGAEISIRDVFEYQKIAELAAYIDSLSKSKQKQVEPIEEQEYYNVSEAQRRLWVLSQTKEGNVAYNINGLFTLNGHLDLDAFNSAFNQLLKRHESLRTAIFNYQGELYQRINDFKPFTVKCIDLSQEGDKQARARSLAQEQVLKPFDLDKGNLINLTLIKLTESEYKFVFTMHHIISDAWSMRVLISEILKSYNLCLENKEAELPDLTLQYKDFMVWRISQSLEESESYWKNKLQGELSEVELPTDFKRPPIKTYNGQRFTINFPDSLVEEIDTFCGQNNVTLFTFLTAATKSLLYRYTGVKDLILGTTIAGRDQHELENQIGFYVNTLALRTKLDPEESFTSFLPKVRETILEGHDHKYFPFERLVDELDCDRGLAHSPLFGILIELINVDFEMGSTPDMEQVSVQSEQVNHVVSKFDITFSFKQMNGLALNVEFNTDLYREKTISSFCDYLQAWMSEAITNTDTSISELELAGYDNTQAHLSETLECENQKTFVESFKYMVDQRPNEVAVQMGDVKLSYSELNAKANRLAKSLQEDYTIGVNDRVAVMLDHSCDMIVSLLGIIKTGAAFVPVDPQLPSARIKLILAEVEAKLLIIESYQLLEISEVYNGSLFTLDLQLQEDNTEINNAALDADAYIIFTSGSTGVPKGVAITQSNLMNYLLWANEYYFDNKPGYNFGLFTSISFDLSITAIFTTLLRGDKLVLFDQKNVDKSLQDALDKSNELGALKITPSHIQMISHLNVQKVGLKTIIVGGEALKPEHLNILDSLGFEGQLYNEYGPTETTVGCTVKLVEQHDNIKSVGKPVANTHIFILDANGKALPAGIKGEICVAGANVSRGYINDKVLTKEKFVSLSIGGSAVLVYKTGDLGRQLENGEIEYLGRKDEQVKVRGHRVELPEIETTLSELPLVETAVVRLCSIEGEKQLVAYVVAEECTPNVLKDFLSKKLPAYMIPSCFVFVNYIPLTVNGKVNVDALPDPVEGLQSDFEAPETKLEKDLLNIWQQVLGKDEVGVTDNFFDLGGHSLKATQIAFHIRKDLDVEIQLKDIFSHPSIRDLANIVGELVSSDHQAIPSVETQDYYDVSHAQGRMWMLHQLEEQKAAYNIPGRYIINGDLSIGQVEETVKVLIARHESLRTSFVTVDGKPKQRIQSQVEVGSVIEIIDLQKSPKQEHDLQKLVDQETYTAFDLEAAPLFRLKVIKLEDQKHALLFTIHHIVSDGWSMDVLINEFLTIYKDLNAEVPNLRIQYKDFSSWQSHLLSKEGGDSKSYWLDKFKEGVPVLDLPLDYPRPSMKTFNGNQVSELIGGELTKKLKTLASEKGVSLFVLLQAAINSFLYKYTDQTDIVLGTPVAGRDHADLENQIGLYVNTLALYNSFRPDSSFDQLLDVVNATTMDAFNHQSYPFDKLVEELDIPRDMSRSPLFDVFLVVNHLEGDDASSLGRLKISGLESENTISKFDLHFTFNILESDINISLGYNTDLFDRPKVEGMVNHLRQLLGSISSSTNDSIKDLKFLTQEEKDQLLTVFNNTVLEYDTQSNIQTLLESSAKKWPEKIVLKCKEKRYSYEELNYKVNQLADYLINEKSIGKGNRIGLITDRSAWLLISQLAILKTGNSFVAIDSEYPAERVDYIINDAHPELIIAETAELAALISIDSIEVIVLDEIEQSLSEEVDNPAISIDSNDPAYIIYTSGSTGTPKGVVIAHSSVNAFLAWAIDEFKSTDFDIVFATTSYCFDLSIYELFYPLAVGKSIRLLTNGLEIPKFLDHESNILLNTVPSVIKGLLEEGTDFSNVTAINMAGEPIPLYVKHKLENQVAEIRNLYGPSEDTTYSTCYRFDKGDKAITIGKPINNTKVFVLNEELNLVPVGVPGELCITGEGLAKGYLNHVDLTAEKFVKNPFNNDELMYRTGDVAKWLPNGQLSFLGRKDNQVKVRGYRIELGEIESVIEKFPEVSEVLTLVRNNGEQSGQIVAYFIADGDIDHGELKSVLQSKLPAYMVPAHLAQVDHFPLTPNGKIDRSKLPDPVALSRGEEIVNPRDEVEEKLLSIWKEVLGTNDLGVFENFFAVGGDSIKALQIASRVHNIGLKLEVRHILKYVTIARIAKEVGQVEHISQEPVIGELPLTPIQKRFFTQKSGNQNHYNQSVMFFKADGFDEEVLQKSIAKLFEHHDMLRAHFEQKGQGVVQKISGVDIKELPFNSFDQNENDKNAFIDNKANWAQRSLDIEKGKVANFVLMRCDDGDRFLIVIHHLIVDGVSWRILLEDFQSLYQGYLDKASKLSLPNKTTSFKEWAKKLNDYAESSSFKSEAAFWSSFTGVKQESLSLEVDSESNLVKDSSTETFWLDEKYTEKLLKQVNFAYSTEITTILLAAIGEGFQKQFGLDQIQIDLEGHGRENIVEDVQVSRTVGWFTSLYPLQLDLSTPSDIQQHLINTKETLNQIPNKGVGYGIWKYLFNGEHSESEESEVVFNYLGQFDNDIKRSGMQIAKESVGDTIDPNMQRDHMLEVNGAVVENKLQLSLVYGGRQFTKEVVKSLLDHIKSSLTEIIDWCVSIDEKILTPSDLTYSDLSVEEVAELNEKFELEDIYPLSPMQEGLFFHILMDKNSSYFEQLSYTLEGDLNVEMVEKSVNELFKRYDILRAGIYQQESGNPLQLIFKERKIDFDFRDLSQRFPEEQQRDILDFKEKDKQRSFDLLNDTLLRVAVLKLDDNRFEFVWSYHHILLDGWCMSVLFTEYLEVYSSLTQNRPYSLPEVKPYKNYIKWLSNRDYEISKKYWYQYLKDYNEKASIPSISTKRGEKDDYAQDELFFELNKNTTDKLKQIAQNRQITVNTLFQAIWGILLSKYSGKQDVVFGEVVSGRPAEVDGIEKMVGLFINTVPVRVSYTNETTFDQLIDAIHNTAVKSEAHQYSPLVDIQSVSVLKKDLFDHILMLGNYPVFAPIDESKTNEENDDLSVSNVKIFEQVSYNLNVGIGVGEKALIKFNFNKNVYNKAYLSQLANHFSYLVDQVTAQSNVAINQMELLREEEKAHIVDLNEAISADAPFGLSIHNLFESQVAQSPDAIALVSGSRQVTYTALNQKANSLAHYIRSNYAIEVGDRIGLMVSKSEEMIISILAILKTGAAYVPIDPDYPVERIAMILDDAQVKVLLTESDIMFGLGDVYGGELFALDIQMDALEPVNSNVSVESASSDLAYIMYTSGSTGKPKGVQVEHEAVVRLVHQTNYMNLNGEHRVMQLSNFAFDGSVFDIFGSLLNGASLYLVPKEVLLSNEKLVDFIELNNINVTFITTALFNNLVDLSPQTISNFDKIYFGGEEASLSHIRKALENRKEADSIVHVYGPTENTTFSTYHIIDELDELQLSVPIGRPIANTTAYILDDNLNPLPIGVIGEICLGGRGLARGYWMNEELTNEKFIIKDFGHGHKERLYLTGDLGRLLPDESIDFKGRKDKQVKIRGNRVELGEIENIMLRHEEIEQVHLVFNADAKGKKELAAYYTGEMSDLKSFRTFMKKYLPSPMIPAYFIRLEKMPYNANGKIDEKLLPDPRQNGNKSDNYVAPRNDLEKRVVQVWESVLKKKPIGVKDNFFLIGGDSIVAIRLVSALNKEFGTEIEVKDIFYAQDIVTLTEEHLNKIESTNKSELASVYLDEFKNKILANDKLLNLMPAGWEDVFPASDIQKGMLFYSTAFDSDTSGIYHDQIFYQFADESFSFETFLNAFDMLVAKHEMLRTSFDFENFEEEVQIVHKAETVKNDIDFIDISFKTQKQKKQFLQDFLREDRKRPFTIEEPGLWRLRVIKLGDNDYGVLLIIHHAIIDGWSEASLRTELSNLYYSLKGEQNVVCDKLKSSYRDFVAYQLQQKNSKEYVDFWKEQLDGYQKSALPFNRKVNLSAQKFETNQQTKAISREVTDKVVELSNSINVPVKTIFMAAFAYLIKVTTAKNDITFGSVTNGRPPVEDGDKIIGCFLNTIPIRVFANPGETVESFIKQVHSKEFEVKEYDKLPLYKIAEAIGEKTSSANPIFDLLFNYLDLHVIDDMSKEAQGKKALISSYVKTNTHFDFTINRVSDVFHMHLIYEPELFKDVDIDRVFEYYVSVLNAFTSHKTLSATNVIPNNELTELKKFNETVTNYPSEKAIATLFAETAKQLGDRDALVCKGDSLSYKQLDLLSTRFAQYLISSCNLKKSDFVGVKLQKSNLSIVAILGTLKAGGVYVPLAEKDSSERADAMIKQLNPKVIIIEEDESLDKIAYDGQKLKRETIEQALKSEIAEVELPSVESSDLAYVMFTSGSTGTPKGVMVKHKNVVRLVRNTNYIELNESSRLLLTGAIAFDASTFEIWGMLLNGGTLYLAEQEQLIDSARFKELLNEYKINVSWMTAAWFDQVVDEDISVFNNLQTLLIGGDKLSVKHVAKFKKEYPHIKLCNGYGPTENTTFSTYHYIDDLSEKTSAIPIGQPISNTQVYIMDEQLNEVPVEVEGEIVLGGDGLSAGYFENDSLTDEKFVPAPFNKEEKLYRTGDYGLRRKDGIIEFSGRVDNQVKVRGYRIELGEVETTIQSLEEVEKAIVLSHQLVDGTKQLVAYCTCRVSLESDKLKKLLVQKMPDYMVPGKVVILEEFPLNKNGKVDRDKLLTNEISKVDNDQYIEPRNDIEKQLVEIWSQILGQQKISVTDNFFELGGHSLTATRMLTKVHKELDVEINLKKLFQNPTLEQLALEITANLWGGGAMDSEDEEEYRDLII